MTPITIWERLVIEDDETSHYEHNHIENGHSSAWEPTAKTDTQRQAWEGRKKTHHGGKTHIKRVGKPHGWRATHAYLDDHHRVVFQD